MKTRRCGGCRSVMLGVLVATIAAAIPLSASAQVGNPPAYDINGWSRPWDAFDWNNPGTSLPRGGDSDVMTVYQGGKVFAQAFAFGNEENRNVYYFDPSAVQVNVAMYGHYTTLLEPDGAWSDTYGVARFYGVPGQVSGVSWSLGDPGVPSFYALAFMSDWQDPLDIPPILESFVESPDLLNPVPEPGPDDSRYLTIAYDATPYLAPILRDTGYTADFRSDIPEPASLSLLALGIAGLLAVRRRKIG